MTVSDLTIDRTLPNSLESERAGIKTLIEIRCWKEDQFGRSYFVVLQ